MLHKRMTTIKHLQETLSQVARDIDRHPTTYYELFRYSKPMGMLFPYSLGQQLLQIPTSTPQEIENRKRAVQELGELQSHFKSWKSAKLMIQNLHHPYPKKQKAR